jgi:hypothetical protein
MKKYLYLGIILMTGLAACRKDSITKIPVEKSFSDPDPILKAYQTTITSGDGWKAIINPTKNGQINGQYSGLFKFESTGDSRYVMDYSVAAAGAPISNKYRLAVVATNPTLTFPGTSAFGTFALNNTLGVDTAYTFKYQSKAGDTVKLVGNNIGTALTLIKATATESTDYLAGKMAAAITTVNNLNKFKYYYKRVTLGGKDFDMIVNSRAKVITFNSNNGGFQRVTSYYSHTSTGIVLKDRLTLGTLNVKEITGLTVDLTAFTGAGSFSGTSATITNPATPLVIEAAAPARFVAMTPANAWISPTNFTIDGRPDAFGFTTIAGSTYQYTIYYPKYFSNADASFIVYGAGTTYGPAFNITTPANGTLLMSGNFALQGTSPGAAWVAPVTSYKNQLINASGYYVFQTGATNFDIVSVANGNAWMSLEQ